MIKRVLYNSDTGDIDAFLPTTLSSEFVDADLQLYCSCNGDESNLTELSGAKTLLQSKVYDNINSRTAELIDYGIVYKDVRFWCNQEAQQNYTGLYVKKDSALVTYPYTVWDGTGSVSISASDEMDLFCSNVMTHVQTQRVYGRMLRDSLSGLTEVELINYEDPRGAISGE